MTHPATPEVGGEPDAPAETNPFEDMAADLIGEDEQEEEETDQPEGDEPEAEVEDEPEIEADDLPPIDAPSSWTAEEKAKFAELPRDVQETVTRREAEREKFVQSKAQEAAQSRQAAAREAAQLLAQAERDKSEQLARYAQQLAVSPPDARLFAADPQAYAQQLEAFQHYSAQQQQAQREAQEAAQQAEQYEQLVKEQEAQAFRQHLEAELPEFFDETKGPQIKNELTATAKFLGFSDDEIFGATSGQIVALKRISDLKAKADKYDAVMKRQMERVRQGKNPPPISKPGTARNPDQNRKVRAEQAWNAATTAKTRNAREAALTDWAEQSGWLD